MDVGDSRPEIKLVWKRPSERKPARRRGRDEPRSPAQLSFAHFLFRLLCASLGFDIGCHLLDGIVNSAVTGFDLRHSLADFAHDFAALLWCVLVLVDLRLGRNCDDAAIGAHVQWLTWLQPGASPHASRNDQ